MAGGALPRHLVLHREEVMGRRVLGLLALLALVLLLIVLSLLIGTVNIPFGPLLTGLSGGERYGDYDMHAYILGNVRLPRTLLCLLTGLALGISGCVMQGMLRNPLASPFTLGVSGGAGFGAALAMVLGVGLAGPQFAQRGLSMVAVNAFLFGGLAMGLVLLVGKRVSQDRTVLILLGTAINSLFGAGIAVLKYVSNAEVLKNLDLWLMGGFWGANWTAIRTLLPILVVTTGLMLWQAWAFNALNAGEDVAATLGVNVAWTRTLALVSMTLVASVTIAFSGIIGFVGLVAPHVARSLFGVDYRFLILASCGTGAALLLAADLLARTVAPPREIPVGIITAIIGVPFFIWILTGRRRLVWGSA